MTVVSSLRRSIPPPFGRRCRPNEPSCLAWLQLLLLLLLLLLFFGWYDDDPTTTVSSSGCMAFTFAPGHVASKRRNAAVAPAPYQHDRHHHRQQQQPFRTLVRPERTVTVRTALDSSYYSSSSRIDLPDPFDPSSLLSKSYRNHSSSYYYHFYLLRHGQSTANVDQIISSNATALSYTDTHGLTEVGYQQARTAAAPLFQLIQERMAVVPPPPPETAKPPQQHVVQFVSSPFARARQTAQACCDELQTIVSSLPVVPPEPELVTMIPPTPQQVQPPTQQPVLQVVPDIRLDDGLRERSFGRFDGQDLSTYAYVWPLDQFDVTHTTFGVESVASVCHRMRQLLWRCLTGNQNENEKEETKKEEDEEKKDHDAPCESVHYHIVLVGHADVLQIAQVYAAAAASPDLVDPHERAQLIGSFSSYRLANGEVRPLVFGTTQYLPPPVPLSAPRRGTFRYHEWMKQAATAGGKE